MRNEIQHLIDTLPAELKALPQWVVWHLEERREKKEEGKKQLTKVPYNALTGRLAASDNAATWATFGQAIQAWQDHPERYTGVGFVFNNDYTGVDFDHCVRVDDGTIDAWAQQDIDVLASYSEYSQSGTGVHTIARALLPEVWDEKEQRLARPGTRRKVGADAPLHPDAARELYCERRFFAMTGKHVPGTPTTIEDRQGEILALHARVTEKPAKGKRGYNTSVPPRVMVAGDDDDTLIRKAMNATNGAKFTALWQGDTSGYISASEADQALCHLLAFWTGKDEYRIDTLFRRSSLYREEKWDRPARSGERYGEGTIARAIESCTEVYTPHHAAPPNQSNGHHADQEGGGGASPSIIRPITRHAALDKALAERNEQALYDLSETIAMFDSERLATLKIALRKIFGRDFPLREYEQLLTAQRERLLDAERRNNVPVPIAADEFMRIQRTPRKDVVPGVFYEGLYIVAGKSKIGKSWLGLGAGMAIAAGGQAFGTIQVLQGEALYLDLEDNDFGLEDRIKTLLPPGGSAPSRFFVQTAWPRLDAVGLDALEAFIQAHPDLRMVIIDPWVDIKPRIKYRSGTTLYDSDYEALQGVKRLADTYHLCILIYFHTRKEGAEDPFDEINASSGAPACADGSYILKRGRGEADATLWGTSRTFKGEVNIALSFKDGYWTYVGDAAVYTLTKERKLITQLLHAAGKPLKPSELADRTGKTSGAIRKLLYDMKHSGLVDEKDGAYISLVPQHNNNNNTPPHSSGYGGEEEDIYKDKNKNKNNNSSNISNASNKGNASNGGNAVTQEGEEGEANVTFVPVRYCEPDTEVTPVNEPVELLDKVSVTALPSLPHSLITHAHLLYTEVKAGIDQLAPLGNLLWNVPGSPYAYGQCSRKVYGDRLLSMCKSGDPGQVSLAIAEMEDLLAGRPREKRHGG